jgi:tetratricopeptide (TPR) repeat protein
LLLDEVHPLGEDEFVRDWYRASMAVKLRVGDLDTTHFERAADLFPRDASVRFLAGCLHEWLADARVRAAAETVKLPRGVQLEVEDEEAELRLAESHYKRALVADQDHVETRVRLGRVLGRLGRHKEAATQLRQAAGSATEPLVAYYAQLFLGAEEEALGRSGEARVAYEHAAALYPRAQAPRLGLSELLHGQGDRVGARTALGPALPASPAPKRDDPWWTYRSAPARHADDLVEALYDAFGPGGAR